MNHFGLPQLLMLLVIGADFIGPTLDRDPPYRAARLTKAALYWSFVAGVLAAGGFWR